MDKKLNKGKFILVGVSLVAVLGYVTYSKYTERLDAELVGIVKNELNELHLHNPGKFIYQQASANRNCNSSDLTVVYASDMEGKEICESLLSSLSPNKWQPQHVQQKSNYCEVRPVSTVLFAHNQDRTEFLALGSYPKENVTENTFMPVNSYAELRIKKEAAKVGRSFYYIELGYRGQRDNAKCPCEEEGAACELANSSYYESAYSERVSNADKSANH